MGKRNRIESIDILRGVVMIIMALDHARYNFFGPTPGATDLAVTTPILFFTRWVTHFCAPLFVFLSGISAFLYEKKYGLSQLKNYLLTRGLMLILLEVTIVRMGFHPNLTYEVVVFQVIGALGTSMILLGLFSRMPKRWLALIGLLIFFGHDSLNFIEASTFGGLGWVWSLLSEKASLTLNNDISLLVLYPVLPWFSVMVIGYVFGGFFEMEKLQRSQLFITIGAGVIIGYVILRAIGLYGDPSQWISGGGFSSSLMSFLNCEKYPASLQFLLMTLGPGILLLGFLEKARSLEPLKVLKVFGGVPLFFYILHLYLLRLPSSYFAFQKWGPEAFKDFYKYSPGFDLWVSYLAWALTLAILYPACRWYKNLKQNHSSKILQYL